MWPGIVVAVNAFVYRLHANTYCSTTEFGRFGGGGLGHRSPKWSVSIHPGVDSDSRERGHSKKKIGVHDDYRVTKATKKKTKNNLTIAGNEDFRLDPTNLKQNIENLLYIKASDAHRSHLKL